MQNRRLAFFFYPLKPVVYVFWTTICHLHNARAREDYKKKKKKNSYVTHAVRGNVRVRTVSFYAGQNTSVGEFYHPQSRFSRNTHIFVRPRVVLAVKRIV